MTDDASLQVRKRLQKTRRTPSLVTGTDVEVIVAALEGDSERRTELLDALTALADEQPGLLAPVLDRLLSNDDANVRKRSLSFVAEVAAERPEGEIPGGEKTVLALHADELSVIEAALDAIASVLANDPSAFSDAMPTIVDAVMERPAAFSTTSIKDDERRLDRAAAVLSEATEHTSPSTVAAVIDHLFNQVIRQNPWVGQPSESVDQTPRPEPMVLYAAIGAAAPAMAVEHADTSDMAAVATSSNPVLRSAAIEAIEAIATADPDVAQGIPIVVDRLDDDDRNVRRTASRALAAVAETDATALLDHIDDLTTATYDPDEAVRDAVHMTLVIVAEAAPETLVDRVAVFVGMLKTDSASRTRDEIRRARHGLYALTCIGREDPAPLEDHADVVVAALDEETSDDLLEEAVQAIEVLPKRTLDVAQVVGKLAPLVGGDHSTVVRSQAAAAIAPFAERDPNAVEPYVRVLLKTVLGANSVVTNLDETGVRVSAGETLQRIAAVAPDILSDHKRTIKNLLDSDDPEVRAIALRAIGTFMIEYDDFDSALYIYLDYELFDDDDPRVRKAMIDVVCEVWEATPSLMSEDFTERVIQELVELVHEDTPAVRERAYVALGQSASAVPTMVPIDVLLSGLDADVAAVRIAASDALTTLVERNPFIQDDPSILTDGGDIADVAAALDDDVPTVRTNALNVLNEVKPREPEAIVDRLPSILSVMQYPSDRWRSEAAQLLEYVASNAPTATLEYRDDVVDCLGHEESDVRETVVTVLGYLGHEHPTYARDWIPVLRALIDDEAVSVRIATIEALGSIADAVSTRSIDAYDEGIGLFAEGARTIVNRAVDSEYPQERKVAVEALVSLRAIDQRGRIERLAQSDPFDTVERTACQALEQLPEPPVQTSFRNDRLSVPADSLTNEREIEPAAVPTATVGPDGRVVDHEAVLAYDQFDPYDPLTILGGDSTGAAPESDDTATGGREECRTVETTGDNNEHEALNETADNAVDDDSREADEEETTGDGHKDEFIDNTAGVTANDATTDGQPPTEARGTTADAETIPKWLDNAPETIPEPPSISVDFDMFSLDNKLDQGGYATVYREAVTVEDRTVPVAVKLPRFYRGGSVSREEIKRLIGEAKRWAAVDDHDHVVDVLDWGTDDSISWIAMEYMDGGSLADRVGDVSVAEGLYIADCLARSLHYAHLESGHTAHLDITPANVLFRSVDDGWNVPKLADWGLSKKLIELSGSVDGVTPSYAAPEQLASGETVNFRADIYQLGVVLYELFTGVQPFEDAAEVVRYHKLGEEPPAPTTVDPVLPSELDRILTRAMAPKKSKRHNTADKLRSEIRSVQLD